MQLFIKRRRRAIDFAIKCHEQMPISFDVRKRERTMDRGRGCLKTSAAAATRTEQTDRPPPAAQCSNEALSRSPTPSNARDGRTRRTHHRQGWLNGSLHAARPRDVSHKKARERGKDGRTELEEIFRRRIYLERQKAFPHSRDNSYSRRDVWNQRASATLCFLRLD